MRKLGCCLVLVLFLCGCSTISVISSEDVAGEPTVYCKVMKEPDPLLMGGWKCGFNRRTEDMGEYDFNPIAYWLVKKGDKYGLYFYRVTRGGAKRFVGWKDWTINGNEIYSDTGVKFVAKDGAVYYVWQNQPPEQMSRIESN